MRKNLPQCGTMASQSTSMSGSQQTSETQNFPLASTQNSLPTAVLSFNAKFCTYFSTKLYAKLCAKFFTEFTANLCAESYANFFAKFTAKFSANLYAKFSRNLCAGISTDFSANICTTDLSAYICTKYSANNSTEFNAKL